MPKHEGDPSKLIADIHPGMAAEKVIENICLYHQLMDGPTHLPMQEEREKQLEQSGYIPEDWVYYSNTSPLNGEAMTGTDFESLGRNFPGDVEFLVIQGAWWGGVTWIPGVESGGASRYRYYPDNFTVYVRVRPKLLPDNARD